VAGEGVNFAKVVEVHLGMPMDTLEGENYADHFDVYLHNFVCPFGGYSGS
jgi:hypothetical protein